ncbi:CENP-b protein 1 [Gigaspora margarita]|uniref:CENP-b protein 1 n=1 Tax=Gigaspora margarita TaxID=4874 RepID=A0A8H3X5M2_GIGMA|nr:CENP-b protein 1 [Gigaspora margarita]
MLAANATGSEKLKPMVIGKSNNPHCFKKVKSRVALPSFVNWKKDNENSNRGRGRGRGRSRESERGRGRGHGREHESSEYNSSDSETDDMDNNNDKMDFVDISDITCDNYNRQRIFITFFRPFYCCGASSSHNHSISLGNNNSDSPGLGNVISSDNSRGTSPNDSNSRNRSVSSEDNGSNSPNYNRGRDRDRGRSLALLTKFITGHNHGSNRSISPEDNSDYSYGISLEDNNNNSTRHNHSSSHNISPEDNGSNCRSRGHGMSSKNNNTDSPSHNRGRSLSISSDNNSDNNPGRNHDRSLSISSDDNSCSSSRGISPEDDGSNSLGYNHGHNHAMSPSRNSSNSPDHNRGRSHDTSENGSNSPRNMSPDNNNSNRDMSPNNDDNTCRACKRGFLNNDNNNNSNIDIHLLPPHTTVHLQPMDAGIINNFKLKYKKFYSQELIRRFECNSINKNKKLNVLEAIQFISDACKGVTQQTIHNCWKKTEIVDTISGLTAYVNDNEVVPTEEFLDDEQIVELATQTAEFDSSSSDEELVLISHKKGLEALTTFIDYFGQQTDAEFKIEDLRTLKKYNNIVRRKYLANMKQKTLENFF